MNIIVFSKNRPAQLELFLRTFERFFWPEIDIVEKPPIYVIYKADNEQYEYGYEIVSQLHDWAYYFPEKMGFKEMLIDLVSFNVDYTVFFTDDDIFINPFFYNSIEFSEFQAKNKIYSLSLRLTPEHNYCYTCDKKMEVPEKYSESCLYSEPFKWDWTKAELDYGYPFSVDGHIFRTKDIEQFIMECNYKNPNEFEAVIATNLNNQRMNFPKPLMMCPPKQVIVNNAVNIVQTAWKNRSGNQLPESLIRAFLEGKRIDETYFVGKNFRQCHIETEFKMI